MGMRELHDASTKASVKDPFVCQRHFYNLDCASFLKLHGDVGDLFLIIPGVLFDT